MTYPCLGQSRSTKLQASPSPTFRDKEKKDGRRPRYPRSEASFFSRSPDACPLTSVASQLPA